LVALTALGSEQRRNAAVRGVIGPELGPDLKVLVGILREQEAALPLVRDDGAVLGTPVGVANAVPVVEALRAVDERDPAGVGLTERDVGAPEHGHADDHQRGEGDDRPVHGDLLVWCRSLALRIGKVTRNRPPTL